METSFDLILTSAGNSTRFNENTTTHIKKECAKINGRSVLSLALLPFLSFKELRNVIVTYPRSMKEITEKALQDISLPSHVSLYYVEGGKTRTSSVRNGVLFLKNINTLSSFIAIHDGARPFIKSELIKKVLDSAKEYGAAAPILRLTDAIKSVKDNHIISSLERANIVRVQTPQIFLKNSLIEIYSALDENDTFQDDIEPYVNAGGSCYIVPGDEENRKITYSSDLERKEMRVGFGNDIHVLEEGRDFVLGGVKLPYHLGEKAHSDGDVLIHGLIDAILGAYALSDIGHFFPPEDNRWKDAKSTDLLSIILEKVNPKIINIDCVITVESFKLAPYIPQIRENLAHLLKLPIDRISVKAKTNEGLDSLGRDKAVKAEVVILTQ